MDSETIGAAWTFRPVLLFLMGLLCWAYQRGWQTYVQRHAPETILKENSIDTARTGRPWLFYASLLVLFLALCSPIHVWASRLFFVRIAQHLLCISLFPALFMNANPLPAIFHGLPLAWQAKLGSAIGLQTWVRRLTPKSMVWFLFVGTVWLWYDETVHGWTMTRPWVRYIELTTLIVAALFHWWHITGASPRLHRKLPSFAHIGYTLASAAPLKIPGLFMLLATHIMYAGYTEINVWGWHIDPLLSQQLGAVLVWGMGGLVYSTTAMHYMGQWFGIEAEKPVQPRNIWDNEESMLAPGLEK